MMRNRSVSAVVVLLMMGMVAIAGYGPRGAIAQDAELTADLVSGRCALPGDSVGELRSLAEAEGGVLTSFSRVDIPIDDVAGDEHAVVVLLDGDLAACGDVSGSGNDIYIPIVSQSDAGYGGVAWLHARDEQTQISLFISNQLGGSGAGPEPPPGDTETPAPPDDTETPEPNPTNTPRGGEEDPTPTPAQTGEEGAYESPSFGYSFTYDRTWEVIEQGTNATDTGPQDFIHLYNQISHVWFYTNSAPDDYDMARIPNLMLSRLLADERIADVEIRLDENGDEIVTIDQDEAIVAINFTWTNDAGEELDFYNYYHVYRLPGQQAIVIFFAEGRQRAYDQQAAARDALTDSLVLPD